MQAQSARRTRGRWSEDEKRGYVSRWTASGLAAREFGKREGVRPENLYRWQRETAPAAPAARPSVTFTPVKVSAPVEPEQRSLELASGLAIEVELPSGVRVRVYRGADMRAANEVLSALFGRRAC
jgi:transposase